MGWYVGKGKKMAIAFRISGDSVSGISKATAVAPDPIKELVHHIKEKGINGVYYANVDAFANLGDECVMAIPYTNEDGKTVGISIQHTVLEEDENGNEYPETYLDAPIIIFK